MPDSLNVCSIYRAEATLKEQQGFTYTAAFIFRKAAEEASSEEESALCWREWERLTRLDRKLAKSLVGAPTSQTSNSLSNLNESGLAPSSSVQTIGHSGLALAILLFLSALHLMVAWPQPSPSPR